MTLRHLVFSLCISACCIPSEGQQIVVKLETGNVDKISLLSSPKIQFTSSEFLIHTPEYDITYPLTQIDGYYFIPSSEASINDTPVSDAEESQTMQLENDVILIYGVKTSSIIEIFNCSGMKIMDKKLEPGAICHLSLESLSPGFYIARSGNCSIKFLRK